LAVDALRRSDSEFRLAPEYLEQARRSGIDIEVLKTQFTEASVVHKNVLDSLSTILPKSFVWSPEKSSPTVLSLKDLLIDSVMVRDNAVDFLY